MFFRNYIGQRGVANTRHSVLFRAAVMGMLTVSAASISATTAQADASDDYVACLIGRASVAIHRQEKKDSGSALAEAYKHCAEPQGASENELEGISDYVNTQVEAMMPDSYDRNNDGGGTISAKQMWVTSDRLNRRTCPEEHCGIVGTLMFREEVKVLEERNGFARVSPYYDAACTVSGSSYVDRGNSACSPENGINDGKLAEWVSMDFLSAVRPNDPAKQATGLERLISGSDDFHIYRAAFVSAAEKLIANGQCTEADFIEQGGWMKSTNNPSAPVYFTYCGGMGLTNRIYLDAATGNITQ